MIGLRVPLRLPKGGLSLKRSYVAQKWIPPPIASSPGVFQVVYQNTQFIIINKAPGIAVQGRFDGSSNWGILNYLVEDDPEIKTVHRLDKNVTGGVVFARNKQVAQNISRNLQKGGNHGFKFTRRYVGLVKDADVTPSSNVKYLDPGKTKGIITTTTEPDALEETKFIKTSHTYNGYRLVVIHLTTGKKHQIRRHFAQELRSPLLNDPMYGGEVRQDATAIGLHSAFISLRIGRKTHEYIIPIHFDPQLWSGFVDEEGEFPGDVKEILDDFDAVFEDS